MSRSNTRAVVCLLTLIAPGALLAQAPEPTADETAFAGRVVDAACLDLSPHQETCDRVLLLHSETLEGMADLLIVRGDGTAEVIVARDFATHRSQDGYRARLEAGADRTLLVHSEQSGHGRYPWFETLTIRFREEAFLVVDYSYSTYDRPMGGDFSCRVDLLSGAWQVSAVRIDPETGDDIRSWDVTETGHPDETDIRWWSFREPPAHCAGIMADWFDRAP